MPGCNYNINIIGIHANSIAVTHSHRAEHRQHCRTLNWKHEKKVKKICY